SQLKTGHPVRSAIHKQLNGRLVLRWVTTWESLLLYVLHLFALISFTFRFMYLLVVNFVFALCGGVLTQRLWMVGLGFASYITFDERKVSDLAPVKKFEYFYLSLSETHLVSLDESVIDTKARPFEPPQCTST
ncbi:hypothetical protein KCU85_g4670, partial [Aureobasidium melanogenum]